MNQRLLDYIKGKTNIIRDEFIISREKCNNGEVIYINEPETETLLYALWRNKKLEKKRKVKITKDGDCVIEKVKPKNTGGKYSYVMLYENSYPNGEKLSLEAAGLLLKFLRSNIEWNTCRLIRKRDKKGLTKQMISEEYGIGMVKLKKLLSELTKNKFIEYRNKAYYLNKAFARKGGNYAD